uniref:Uncharacterized protein n=1 Tax=Rhizophora mucronata TaxID=61149 RepID=A0A2P2QU66_RHIMU
MPSHRLITDTGG